MKRLEILFLLIALCLPVFADVADGFNEDEIDTEKEFSDQPFIYNINARTRYRKNENDEYRIQQRIKIGVELDINDRFKVVSLIRSGDGSFQGTNFDLYDDETGKYDADIGADIAQLYMEGKLTDNLSGTFGAMGPRSSKGDSTELSSSGYIDGARLELETKFGAISVTTASLDKRENVVGFYDRDFDLNYFELSMDMTVFKKMLVEAGIESIDEEVFSRLVVSGELPRVLDTTFKYVVEGLYDHERESVKWAAGIEFDIAELITGNTADLRFRYQLTDLDESFETFRGRKNSSGIYSQPGKASVFQMSGNISKKRGLEWFVRYRKHHEGGEDRYETGIVWKWHN